MAEHDIANVEMGVRFPLAAHFDPLRSLSVNTGKKGEVFRAYLEVVLL